MTVFGSSSTSSTTRGYLYAAIRSLQNCDERGRRRRACPATQGDECLHRLPAVGVRHADHGRLADRRVLVQHVLDLARPHLEARRRRSGPSSGRRCKTSHARSCCRRLRYAATRPGSRGRSPPACSSNQLRPAAPSVDELADLSRTAPHMRSSSTTFTTLLTNGTPTDTAFDLGSTGAIAPRGTPCDGEVVSVNP